MAKLRVGNNSRIKTVALFVEPWDRDCWLRPGDEVTVAATEAREPDAFSVDMFDDGIQVWVEAYEAVVVMTDTGAVLECGHQRPA
jgi:hypothetical protein